jgi:hypothetical protein
MNAAMYKKRVLDESVFIHGLPGIIKRITADTRAELLTHHHPSNIEGDDQVESLTVKDHAIRVSRQQDVTDPKNGFIDANHRGEIKVDSKGHNRTEDISTGSGASAALSALD